MTKTPYVHTDRDTWVNKFLINSLFHMYCTYRRLGGQGKLVTNEIEENSLFAFCKLLRLQKDEREHGGLI